MSRYARIVRWLSLRLGIRPARTTGAVVRRFRDGRTGQIFIAIHCHWWASEEDV